MSDEAIEKIRNTVAAMGLLAAIVALILTGHGDKTDWLIFALVMLVLFG